MTKKEAAIVSAFTGILIGKFDAMHGYIEKKLGRPVLVHELTSEKVVEEVKQKSKEDFVSIEITE
jgi:hypothetical protein